MKLGMISGEGMNTSRIIFQGRMLTGTWKLQGEGIVCYLTRNG